MCFLSWKTTGNPASLREVWRFSFQPPAGGGIGEGAVVLFLKTTKNPASLQEVLKTTEKPGWRWLNAKTTKKRAFTWLRGGLRISEPSRPAGPGSPGPFRGRADRPERGWKGWGLGATRVDRPHPRPFPRAFFTRGRIGGQFG